MKLNRKRSRELAERVGAKNKQCWSNALLATSLLGDEARYVEGWVVTDLGLLVEHGWVQWRGQILDPTPTYHERQRRCRYFPGVRFTLREAVRHDGAILPITKTDFGPYRAAYSRAHAAAYGCTPEELAAKLERIPT